MSHWGRSLPSRLFRLLAFSMHLYGDVPQALGFMVATSLLIVFKHHENIRRLLAGTENRMGAKRA